ncbi:MAG: S1 family peptidase [Spirochaetota bacterium]
MSLYRTTRLLLSAVLLAAAVYLSSCTHYNAREISTRFSRAVVLICNMYYIQAETEEGVTFYIGRDYTGTDVRHSRDRQRLVPFLTFGTGFFIGKNGLIATNRHIAYPWESKIREINDLNDDNGVLKNLTYEPVFTGIIPNGSLIDISTSDNLVSVVNKVAQSFYQCDIIKHHSDPDVDLALIQMQARTLPPHTGFIRESSLVKHTHDFKKGSDIYMIGFPGGLSFATTRKTLYREIENTLSSGIISKISDKYNIQYTLSTGSGSSGSPVFNQHGKVIAVNYAVSDLQGALINYGIKSGYIHDMLEEMTEFSLRSVLGVLLVRLLLLFIPLAAYNVYRIVRDDIIDLEFTIYGIVKLVVYVTVSAVIIIMNRMV